MEPFSSKRTVSLELKSCRQPSADVFIQ